MIKKIGKISALCLLVASASSFAASPVWKVSKGDQTLFLGGTVHVLSQSDYPLPDAFDKAYKQAKTLAFETDLLAAQTPEFSQQLMAKMMFNDGQTLKSALNAKTYQALEAHLSSRGVPIANMLQFKPSMMSITLTMIELQRLGMAGTGVDEYYFMKGQGDAKSVLTLETPAEQIDFLANLGQGQENEMIELSLKDAKEMPEMMGKLKTAWRVGDNKALAKVALDPWVKDFPQMYNDLIVKRNNNWLPLLEKMLKTPETELVLVGALHLVGDDGVLTLLKKKGYTIENL